MNKQTVYVNSYGKGGNTSSGNWHIHCKAVKLDYKQRPYSASFTITAFTKKKMLEKLADLQEQHNVIMPV